MRKQWLEEKVNFGGAKRDVQSFHYVNITLIVPDGRLLVEEPPKHPNLPSQFKDHEVTYSEFFNGARKTTETFAKELLVRKFRIYASNKNDSAQADFHYLGKSVGSLDKQDISIYLIKLRKTVTLRANPCFRYYALSFEKLLDAAAGIQINDRKLALTRNAARVILFINNFKKSGVVPWL
jgi:hypothetical protein